MEVVRSTTAGLIRGTCADALMTWRGVPYAEAPVGGLRWQAPKKKQPWEGILDCTEYGEVAAQPIYSWRDKIRGAEDCLNLDIVRPNTDEELPVVVYFHGGSFIYGSSSETMLRGFNFVQSLNVVYVSLNFRLGVLGYLDLRSLGADCVANPAIRDHLLALKWIRDNIAEFGGDPSNVTIMGESAGGSAVTTLMCVPAARGLFHKAIAQSAPAATMHSEAQAEYWARELVFHMALPRAATLDDLRQENADDLVRAGQTMLWRSRMLLQLNTCYGPAADGSFLPDHPLALFERGAQAPVPLLIGTNSDEASFSKVMYLRQTARAKAALRMLEAFDPENASTVLDAYRGGIERTDFSHMLTDALFWAPSVRVAENHAKIAPTWMYRFDFSPLAMRMIGLGAMHSLELTAIFGDRNASRASALHSFGGGDELSVLTDEMQAMWGQFIWSSNPGGDWPQYGSATDTQPGRATKIFNVESQVLYDPNANRRKAWSTYDMLEWGGGRAGDRLDIQQVRGT